MNFLSSKTSERNITFGGKKASIEISSIHFRFKLENAT